MAQDIVDLLAPLRDVFRQDTFRRPGQPRKVRVDITPAEGPFLDLSERGILAPIAAAVLEELRSDFAGVNATVTDETVKSRRTWQRLFSRGNRSALRRYSGGRIGVMPPGGGDRALHDSGRLERSLVAAVTGTQPVRVSINVAANRLTPESFPGTQWERFTAQLVRWVPALAPGVAFTRTGVRNALVGVLGDRLSHLEAEARRKRVEIGRVLGEIITRVIR